MSDIDVDILSINAKILEKFQLERLKLGLYISRLAELKKTLESNISVKAQNEIKKSIELLEKTIENIQNDRELNFYIVESNKYIEQYNLFLKTPQKLSFIGKPVNNNKEKLEIVQKYIEIAQKYINITPININEKKIAIVCDNCPNKKKFIIDGNIYICNDCGCQQEILQYTSSYKDSDRVNISQKYTYDRKVHFRDCMNQYQGKQNCTIEQKVYDDLEKMFENHHLLIGTKDTPRGTRFANITKETILMFLKELKYSKHYENVTLIHYNITGIKPDDISHLEDKLTSDFDLLVETYDKHFKNKIDRVNFISTQYVLFQLLQRHKHQCKKEDFVILKTIDRKSFHDEIALELFSLLGWNIKPISG